MAFKRKILIVDDEPTILSFLKDGLSSHLDSFEIHIAGSGEEALEIMEAHRIALLTTDIRMPEMDGFQLIRQAKQKNPQTRFIVMTAYGSDEIFEKSMEYGAIDYIKKPFTIDRFVKKLFRALEPARGFKTSSLHGFQLTDALQLVHMVHKSQTIRVKTEFGDVCLIHLKDGEVVHAEMEHLAGEEAFYKIIALEGGEIESLPLPINLPITIERPLAALILEGMRLKDEREAATKERRDGGKIPWKSPEASQMRTDSGGKDASRLQSTKRENQRGESFGLKTTDAVITLEQDSFGRVGIAGKEEGDSPLSSEKEFYRLVDEGYDSYRTGDLDGARKRWEKALELRPDDGAVQFNLSKLAEREAELDL
jgi:CheY-like chemotaxis protein